MQDERRLPFECLGVALLLFVIVSHTSVVNAFDDVTEIGDLPSLGNRTESSRNKRAIPSVMTTLDYGVKLIALTDFVMGNVIQSFDNSEDGKNHQEMIDHFERIQMELEQQTKELESIHREIQKLGLSLIYFEHEEKIKDSLFAWREYLRHPNQRNLNRFTEKAVHLDQSIRILIEGLLGQHSLSPDIMAVMRDAAKCDSRKLRNSVRSIGSLIMTGLKVRRRHQRIINSKQRDSWFFKKFIETSLVHFETRLDDMVTECQADETNVSDEMRRIMEATLTDNSQTIADKLLKFLEEKYDTKKWVVFVKKKSYYNSTWTSGFHEASVRNDEAYSISVDRQANFTEFRKLIDIHLKEFEINVKHYSYGEGNYCYCLKSLAVEQYLNRFLIPVRAKSEFEMETLVYATYRKWQNFTVATSEGEHYISMPSSCQRHHCYRCHYWVIVLPTRPAAISFNPSSPSTSPLRNQIKCSYDPDRAAQEYGPLRNERAQAYLSVQSREDGAYVILDRQWRNSSGQRWKFVDGQLRNGFGKCLTARNGQGVYVQQYDCLTGSYEQKWRRRGLHILNQMDRCLVFEDKIHSDPMFVELMTTNCDSLSSYIWYNRDTDCEDAMVIPSTTNASRPLHNEFSRLFLNVVDEEVGQNSYGTEQP